MSLTIYFGPEPVKTLNQHLHATFRAGDLPLIKRTSALCMPAGSHSIWRLGFGALCGRHRTDRTHEPVGVTLEPAHRNS